MMEIAAEGRKKGFHIPAIGISQGFRAHGSKKRAIRTVADFDGLKIRVPNAQEVFHRMENALGANPQGIAQSETYSGLRTGVVDGTTAPPSDLWDRRQYEVLDWVTIDTHATGPDPLMVNLAWYQRLPADLRSIFDEVAREALESTATSSTRRAKRRSSPISPSTSRSSVRPPRSGRDAGAHPTGLRLLCRSWRLHLGRHRRRRRGVEELRTGEGMKRLELILVRVLEIVCGICFLVMFTLIVTQVALRYGFNESIGGANELATILFAYTSALGIAIGIARRDHMAISWFTERFGPRSRKTIDVIGLVLLALLNAVIFWYSHPVDRHHRGADDLGPPGAPLDGPDRHPHRHRSLGRSSV